MSTPRATGGEDDADVDVAGEDRPAGAPASRQDAEVGPGEAGALASVRKALGLPVP